MIMAFPTPLWRFDVLVDMRKGEQLQPLHMLGLGLFTLTAPITLKRDDCLLVDIRHGKVEEVARGRIVIWRATSVN